jgi:hypothetical protein
MSEPTEREKHIWDQRAKIILDDVSYSANIVTDKIRWLLSLGFLLNGGALISLSRTDQQILKLIEGPGWLYLGGIICGVIASAVTVITHVLSAGGALQALWRGEHIERDEYLGFGIEHESFFDKSFDIWFSLIAMLLFVGGSLWFGYLIYSATYFGE